MKKIFLCLLLFLTLNLACFADSMPNLKYKNIEEKDKISFDIQTGVWSDKIDKKSDYFVKTQGFGEYYDYLDSNQNFAFSTDCDYEFIYKNSLIGYSNRDMKFYDILYGSGGISKRELSKEEVEAIFPEYKVICFSEFRPLTNSIKLKKSFENLKIILLNDSDKTFDNYRFTSGNARISQYKIRGFLTVKKTGMVQFAKEGGTDKDLWYVILVR